MSRLLPDPTLFDPPSYRILVRWEADSHEQVITTAVNGAERDMWLETLRRAKAHSVRAEPVQG